MKGCEAFQVHMAIAFDTFMNSTWLMTKRTSCSFFRIFSKVGNLIISDCLRYSVFHSLVTIKYFWPVEILADLLYETGFLQQDGGSRHKLHQS